MKTKTEYVKVEFANDKELAKAYSEMDLYYHGPLGYLQILNIHKLLECKHHAWGIYKKVEVDVDVKEDLRNYLGQCRCASRYSNFNDYLTEPRGLNPIKFDKEFVGACHLIAELTDDPRGE